MNSSLSKGLRAVEEQLSQTKKELIRMVRIPSISFEGYDRKHLEEAARLTHHFLSEGTGLRKVKLIRMKGAPPYIYGETRIRSELPTVLLYAHYDVQPTMGEHLWTSPPFMPQQRKGRLYGRGVTDDKAGIMVHVASLRALQATTELPVNIKVLVEGEEEVGSRHLEIFMKRYKDLLQADAVIVVDTANHETGRGTLTTRLRGLVSAEVTVTSMEKPLHSGLWGGSLPDPVMGLCKTLSLLVDAEGRWIFPVSIKDKMGMSMAASTEDSYRSLGMNRSLFRRQAAVHKGVKLLGKQSGVGLLDRLWKEPSLVINVIDTGGRKEAGNVLMHTAWARLGIRIVPPMRSKVIYDLLSKQIKAACPWGLQIHLKPDSLADGWCGNPNKPLFWQMTKALKKAYGVSTAFVGSGGSIPFVNTIATHMKHAELLLIGISDPYSNVHGKDESLHLGDFKKAILSQVHFFHQIASMEKEGKKK